MDSGVAQEKIDLTEYSIQLEKRLGLRQSFVRGIKDKLNLDGTKKKTALPKIVFPEGSNHKILSACDIILQEQIAEPILLGNETRIRETIQERGIESLKDVKIITPSSSPLRKEYSETFWSLRQRRGLAREQAFSLMKNENFYGSMMVHLGHADGLLSGVTQSYPDTIRPFLQIVGSQPGVKIAGVYMMLFKERILFFADTTVNIEPNASDLADIAIHCAAAARFFDIEPKVAMLPLAILVRTTTQMRRKCGRLHGLCGCAARTSWLMERCKRIPPSWGKL
jgi:malate dehydrogenase (oxaloacetate-decarboxylating)(NADP+)